MRFEQLLCRGRSKGEVDGCETPPHCISRVSALGQTCSLPTRSAPLPLRSPPPVGFAFRLLCAASVV
jgi:hypothetical protein